MLQGLSATIMVILVDFFLIVMLLSTLKNESLI